MLPASTSTILRTNANQTSSGIVSSTGLFAHFESIRYNSKIAGLKLLIEAFRKELNRQILAKNAFSHADKLSITEQFKDEIRADKQIPKEARRRLVSYANLEIERFTLATKIENTKAPFLHLMKDPAADCWRLVMDGKMQNTEYGAYRFEDERGYMAGVLRGFSLMLDTLNYPLTPDLYCQLQIAAVTHVRNKVGELFILGYPYGFPDTSFGLMKDFNYSEEGLKEFKQSSKNGGWIRLKPYEDILKLSVCRDDGNWRMSHQEFIQRCDEKAKNVIDTYHTELTEANQVADSSERETAILACVAKCCQDLDQHHLYRDGNIRTAVFLVMNKLLLQNNLSPAILHEPNVFDMYSVAEIVAFIREGQRTFGTLLTSTTA